MKLLLIIIIFLPLSANTIQSELWNNEELIYNFYIENKIYEPNTLQKTSIIFKGKLSIQDYSNQIKLGELSEVEFHQKLGLSSTNNESFYENILFKLVKNGSTIVNHIIFENGISLSKKNLVKVILVQLVNDKFNYTATKNIFDYDFKQYSHKTKHNGINTLLKSRIVVNKENIVLNTNTLQMISFDSFEHAKFSCEIKLYFKNKIKWTRKYDNFVEESIESIHLDNVDDFKSIKHTEIDTVQKILNLSKSIGSTLTNPHASFSTIHFTMTTYVNLVHLLRLASKEDLDDIAKVLMVEDKPANQYLSMCSTEPFDGFYVFKRALSQAYTTESLNMIENWMITGKISRNEACDLTKLTLQTLRYSITEEYANALYSLIRNALHYMPENDITIAFAEIQHKFEDKNIKFECRTKHCDFADISTDYIEFLSRKLEDSILAGTNNKRIMLYIQAISSMKSMKVFQIFRPYIAKKRQVSKFQRLRMLSKLENLIAYNNTELFEFLYDLFENDEEDIDIRILAVYLVLLTNPSLQVWLNLAKVANDNTQSANLRSSMASALNSASRSSGELGSKANATMNLLKKEYYREGSSKIYMGSSSYLGNEYSWRGYALASTDSSLQKAIKLSIHKYKQDAEDIGLEFGISSFKNLADVYNRLFQSFQSQVEKQKDNYKINDRGLYSEDITKMLNINQPEDEPLDVNLFYKFGGFGNLFSFDNKTIENLPKQISSMIDYFPNGINCLKTSLGNSYEQIIKIPTISGVILTFSENQPYFLKMTHYIKVNSTTPLSYGETFLSPNATQVNMGIDVSYTKTISKELAMSNLLNYKFGIEHNTDSQVFLKGNFSIVFRKRAPKIFAKAVIKKLKQNIPLVRLRNSLHLKNYTGETTSIRKAIKFLRKTEICNIFSNSTDSEFLIKYSGDCFNTNLSRLMEIIEKKEYASILSLINSFKIQEFSLMLPPTIKKKEITFSYHSIRKFSDQCTVYDSPLVNIENCEYIHYEGTFSFDKTDYSIIMSQYGSNVDATGLFRISFNITNKITNTKTTAIEINMLSKSPNFNELDLNHSLSSVLQTNHSLQLKASFEREICVVYSTIYLRRNLERLKHLKNHPAVKKCQNDLRQYQLEPCSTLVGLSNLLNEIEFNLAMDQKETFNTANSNIWLESHNITKLKNLQILFALKSDYTGLDLTLSRKRNVIKHFDNINIPRILSEVFLIQPFETQCIIEPAFIITFDGKIYASSLNPKWHILIHYLPNTSRISQFFMDTYQRQQEQTMQMSILAKSCTEDSKKIEVLLSIRCEETQHKVLNLKVELDNDNYTYSVVMNRKIMKYNLSEPKSVHFKNFVQIYLIPNNELKIVINHLLYLVYDGYRVKLVASKEKFRGKIWGLCGNMDGDPANDFRKPNGFITNDEQNFTSNYILAN